MKSQLVSKTLLAKNLPKRNKWSHKGDFGKLLIIGGSRRYSGSPALAGLAALRTGTDLVTILAPERAANIIASFSPDLITEPLKGDHINLWHMNQILNLLKDSDAVVLGGGLERRKDTFSFARAFLERNQKPCVIDADAIHAIDTKKKLKPNYILTPHSYEFSVLTGEKPNQQLNERISQVSKHALKFSCTVLLKGPEDIISNGQKTFVNRTGNSFMTKGGTGDTLAGICGALLAMGLQTPEAAACGAYINGRAGDLASEEFRQGVLASDMLKLIPKAMK